MLVIGARGAPTNVHLPLLPFKHMPIYLETNASRLNNMQGFRCFALFPFLPLSLCVVRDEVREEVMRCEGRRNAGTL
jgi:hypothetical protein